MKHPAPRNDQNRFSTALRHYHRAGSPAGRTWEEWVDGKTTAKPATNWLKIILIAVAVIGLIGILVGLFIEMR
jgi:hypothetical protein